MTQVAQQRSIKDLINDPNVKGRFKEILKDREAVFLSSLLSLTNQDTNLRECEPMTIITAALQAAVLDLPIEPNFGYVYIVPYNIKEKDAQGNERWIKKAQFQLGWKGFVQLAQRTGQYVTINPSEVREGDIESYSPLTGEYVFAQISDLEARRQKPIIGYIAYFRLTNGFEKSLFMTNNELQEHAKRYSKTYAKGFGTWKDNFDAMARKTPLKLLLSKFGPMSVKMQQAINSDQAVLNDNLEPEYIDNGDEPITIAEQKEKEEDERFYLQLQNVNSLDDLEMFRSGMEDDQWKMEWLDAVGEKEEELVKQQEKVESESKRLIEQAKNIKNK